jgi:hypothetical protein
MKIDYDFNNIKITPLLETLRLESIDDAEYFSKKYSSYISNSRLGLLLKYGAKEFFEGLGANKEFSSSLSLGSALHQLVLQPDSYCRQSFAGKHNGVKEACREERLPQDIHNRHEG